MKIKTKILSIFLLCVTLFCLTSCSEDEPAPANYERPIVTIARAITAMDTEAYLNCFTTDAKSAYVNGDNYNAELTKTFLPSQSENKRLIKTKTTSDKELEQEKIDELKQQYKDTYKKRIDITKARKLTVDFILQGQQEQTETKKFTVVWVENRWLVFGDVIEEFEFVKK